MRILENVSENPHNNVADGAGAPEQILNNVKNSLPVPGLVILIFGLEKRR